jgi:cyclic pyranopterin phosphate synthase
MVKEIESRREDLLTDRFGRVIRYLRVSVTDRCNLKCIYCHPPQKIEYLDKSDICSFKELLHVVRTASGLGIDKVRLTGGELFLRKDIIKFIHSLNEIDGINTIGLTTNGTLLLPHLRELKAAGVGRINISLDTLSGDLYKKITGSNNFIAVLKSIHEALELGFKIKINMVVSKGINEGEIPNFLRYFLKNSVEVRFIEFMPLCGSRWREEYFFSYEAIIDSIMQHFELHSLASSGVAQEFVLRDGLGLEGKVGIIAPVTRSFCSSCTRLRLSANGELRPCLFSKAKVQLLPILRNVLSPVEREEMIIEAFKQALETKPVNYHKIPEENDVYIRSLGG